MIRYHAAYVLSVYLRYQHSVCIYPLTHDNSMLCMSVHTRYQNAAYVYLLFPYLPVLLWKTAQLAWIVEAALCLEGLVTDFPTFKFITDGKNRTDARLLRWERHVMVWRQEKKNKCAKILSRQNFYLSNRLTCAPRGRCDKNMQIYRMEPTLKTYVWVGRYWSAC